MKYNKLYLLALLSLIPVYGCDEASESSNDNPPQDTKECTTDSACESQKCLDTGVCAKLAEENASCDDKTVLCKSPFVCKNGKCAKDGEPGEQTKKCTNNESCGKDRVCVNSKCVDIQYLKRGDACTPNNQAAVCSDDMTCYENTCMTQEDIDNAGKCKTNDDCANQAPLTECLPDGTCGLHVDLGELCDETTLCKEPAVCFNSSCAIVVGDGETCNDAEYIECQEGFVCSEGTCHEEKYDQPVKSPCHKDYAFCQSGLECQEGKCVKIAKEDESCDESAGTICEVGKLCLKGICTPIGNSCSSSTDCKEKDSFCCLSEECGMKGHCIPFDNDFKYDPMCLYKTKPGIFEAQIQCRWKPTDVQTGSNNVEMPPIVGPFGNSKGIPTVIAVWSYSPTVIRFINPENCETLESIPVELSTRWYNYPAAADFDGDGLMEFIIGTKYKTYLYKWDPTANGGKGGHILKSQANVDYRPMPLLYDIDNDGNTEIVGVLGSVIRVNKSDLSMEVLTSKELFKDPNDGVTENWENEAGSDAAIGNIDNDAQGIAELVTAEGLYTWDGPNKAWKKLLTFPWHHTSLPTWVRQFTAYADFGTYDPNTGNFDFTKLDGKAEIVISGKNKISLYAIHKDSNNSWSQKNIMEVGGFTYGGPITIGDFNNDGLPEIGIASSGLFGVYDPKCPGYIEGQCADKYVMWERWSQDNSSGTTASSLFDFDGDGQAEAVYADECFTRVYDGKNGSILFSAKRSSVTSIEGPVIADIDNDGSAEIVMGSDQNYSCYDDGNSKINPQSPGSSNCVDPLHEGIRCLDDEDCPTGKGCNKTLKLCTCTDNSDCNVQIVPGTNKILQQYVCAPPIDPMVGFMTNPTGASKRTMVKARGTRPAGYNNEYKVCRATRKTTDIGVNDMMIYRDRLDRWVSSRNIWNQHAYNIINVEDDGKVPTAKQWLDNWNLKSDKLIKDSETEHRPQYNNYRLNKQGLYGAGTVPDITGRFIAGSICGKTEDNRHVISGKLCNRGTKPVSTNLPATFFYYDATKPENRGEKICTSYTNTIVGVGECAQVGCKVDDDDFQNLAGKKVIMVTNLDENYQPTTVECNSDNNTDIITIDKCDQDIVIIN
ncbi:MAG: VCBS repeat-containing protein [Proteobacteria bacterium]|nr:VCBS repeat-containing protein [Pseudomonadota bacterium]